MEGPELLWPI
ncbi:Protein of unknown function [Bacillus toyonensis]|nr:Protein of unknown function [Bacillus toyonensis]